jgi:hypothetical protein
MSTQVVREPLAHQHHLASEWLTRAHRKRTPCSDRQYCSSCRIRGCHTGWHNSSPKSPHISLLSLSVTFERRYSCKLQGISRHAPCITRTHASWIRSFLTSALALQQQGSRCLA